jgi:glycosyltransferase involved in cell wall biosynthesis
MRVAINLLGLPSVYEGGVGTYAATLTRALTIHGADDVSVICSHRVGKELEVVAPAAERLEVTDADPGLIRRRLRLATAAGCPQRFGGARRRRPTVFGNCAVVHYALPFMLGPAHQLPTVVSAGDLQHLVWPEFFGARERLARRALWHRSLRAADRLIAYSQYARDLTVDRLAVREDRISVVHLACHARFYEPHRRSLAPSGDYLLYPAAPRPAKNHSRLLRAFRVLLADHPDARLVLCGPAQQDWASLRRLIDEYGLTGSVDLAGHLPLDRLRAYYSSARGLIFPSLHEGFGLPVLESLAAGCPVAAASTTSLPEVAGASADYFDPRNTEEIASAMDGLLRLSASERSARVAAGRARAAAFGMERMALETANVYAAA